MRRQGQHKEVTLSPRLHVKPLTTARTAIHLIYKRIKIFHLKILAMFFERITRLSTIITQSGLLFTVVNFVYLAINYPTIWNLSINQSINHWVSESVTQSVCRSDGQPFSRSVRPSMHPSVSLFRCQSVSFCLLSQL